MHGCVRQPSDGDRAFRCSLYHGELYVPRCRVASTIPGNVHSRTPCRQVLYPGAAVTARACPAPAGIASSTASSALESCRLAPVPTSASRMPLAVYRDMPLAAELVPVGRVRPCLFPPGAGYARAIDAHTAPVNRIVSAGSRKQRQMQALPHAVILPVAKPTPACHATTEAHFLQQVLPWDASVQHEQNAIQYRPVIYSRTSAFWRAWPLRQQRLKRLPQFVTNSLSCHPTSNVYPSLSNDRFC